MNDRHFIVFIVLVAIIAAIFTVWVISNPEIPVWAKLLLLK